MRELLVAQGIPDLSTHERPVGDAPPLPSEIRSLLLVQALYLNLY